MAGNLGGRIARAVIDNNYLKRVLLQVAQDLADDLSFVVSRDDYPCGRS
jgi:hypothetical protein